MEAFFKFIIKTKIIKFSLNYQTQVFVINKSINQSINQSINKLSSSEVLCQLRSNQEYHE